MTGECYSLYLRFPFSFCRLQVIPSRKRVEWIKRKVVTPCHTLYELSIWFGLTSFKSFIIYLPSIFLISTCIRYLETNREITSLFLTVGYSISKQNQLEFLSERFQSYIFSLYDSHSSSHFRLKSCFALFLFVCKSFKALCKR